MSRGSGIGFFEAGNFYPDFIMWLLADDKQHINFIDPKGLRNLKGPDDPKIAFYRTIKSIEADLRGQDPAVTLNSFIISNTRLPEVGWWDGGHISGTPTPQARSPSRSELTQNKASTTASSRTGSLSHCAKRIWLSDGCAGCSAVGSFGSMLSSLVEDMFAVAKVEKRRTARHFGRLVGSSAAMRGVFSLIAKGTKVDAPVLIAGETGTGKDLVAREIHERSARSQGPFVHVNMGALPTELIASELFGHVKGAFTGATEKKIGRFDEAAGGTLFLDEITAMDERDQATLLRVLETSKFRRVGGLRDCTAELRVLSATNLNPRDAVRGGRLREDLLHRLDMLRIVLPPLRRRKADIQTLAAHFLDAFRREFGSEVTGISREAMRLLRGYRWPGNVRELKNVVAQAAVMAERGEIAPEHLPARFREAAGQALRPDATALAGVPQMANMPAPGQPRNAAQSSNVTFPAADGVFLPVGISMDEAQRAFVLKTLAAYGNNKAKAARTLGMSRKALYDRLRRWGMMA